MRISDWSSDVCSSDLSAQEAELRRCPRLHDEEQRVRASRQTLMQEAAKWGYTRVRLDQSGSAQWLFASWKAEQAVTREKQIGRAHVCTPVTNAHLGCRIVLAKKQTLLNSRT